MGDDGLSASELRQRFHKGGSIPDSELSAQQLRARYAIPSNSRDFSTRDTGGGDNSMLIIMVVCAVLGVGALMFLMK